MVGVVHFSVRKPPSVGDTMVVQKVLPLCYPGARVVNDKPLFLYGGICVAQLSQHSISSQLAGTGSIVGRYIKLVGFLSCPSVAPAMWLRLTSAAGHSIRTKSDKVFLNPGLGGGRRFRRLRGVGPVPLRQPNRKLPRRGGAWQGRPRRKRNSRGTNRGGV